MQDSQLRSHPVSRIFYPIALVQILMYVDKFWMVPLSRTCDITTIYTVTILLTQKIKFTLCNKETPFHLLFSSSLNSLLAFWRYRLLNFDLLILSGSYIEYFNRKNNVFVTFITHIDSPVWTKVTGANITPMSSPS